MNLETELIYSSCCSCCSRRPGSATGSGNWWSRRRSMGTPGGATGRGRAEATSTAERAQNRGAGDQVARRPGPAPATFPGSPRCHRGRPRCHQGDAHAVSATAHFRCLLPLPTQQAQKAGLGPSALFLRGAHCTKRPCSLRGPGCRPGGLF